MFKITELREKQLDSDYFLFNPVKKKTTGKKKKELQKTRDVQPACRSANVVF